MEDLAQTASRLCQPGKGLAALDESTGTIGKRLEKAGLTNDEVRLCSPACLPLCAVVHRFQGCVQETRRAYRELFMTADIGQAYAGGTYHAWCGSTASQRLLQSCKVGDRCS